jgi:hypothetical protein
MAQLFTNNASSTLASGITDTATSMTVATGHGARFPAITGADYFLVTLEKVDGTREIVKVTARSGDVLSGLVRAQEGTTAVAFSTGDVVELRVTAETMADALVAPPQIYAGAMREIATVTTTGSQATVTFSGIEGTYRDLMLTIDGRSTGAVNSSRVRMQFNGDTAANYSYTVENRFAWDNTLAGTYIEVGSVPGATTGANYRSTTNAWVRNYASAAAFRSTISQSSIIDATTVVHVQSAGWWENTANGITQITLSLAFGNWVDGSVISLYGIGGEVGGAALNPIYTKYDPFCPPLNPSSLNDEFDVEGSGTGAPPGFTSVGTLTPTWVSRLGYLDVTVPANNSAQQGAVEKTLPAGPFTVVTKIDTLASDAYNIACIYVRSSVSGRLMRLAIGRGTGILTLAPALSAEKYTDISTRSSSADGGAFYAPHVWLRICYDGTNIYTQWSANGTQWVTRLYNETVGTWFTGGNLPDRFGIGLNSFSTFADARAAFDFVRYFPVANADIGRTIGVGSDGTVVSTLPLLLHGQVI